MGRRDQSLLCEHYPAEEALDALYDNAAAVQTDQPFVPTISLSIPSGYLRWRSLRVAPSKPSSIHAHMTTTTQVLLASTRLGATPVLYKNGKRREEEPPKPLTPDEIEARDDLDFYLDRYRREREQAAAFQRAWIRRLQRLGLVQCRLAGLPTADGKPCTCRTCNSIPPTITSPKKGAA